MEKDEDGRLPLHLSCADQAPVSVVSALLAAHPDGEAAGLRRDARVMGIVLCARCLLLCCVWCLC